MMRRVVFGLMWPVMWTFLLGGCATVAPYQREYLAHPGMDLSREASAELFHQHVRDAREGGRISADSAGGGCGCN